MRIVELILDEDQEMAGIEAISVVENPAIEEDFVALKAEEIKLAEVSSDKKILMGALLIPNKPIYRRSGEDEYYIYFSKDTVLKASQMYLMKGNQNNSTLEHQYELSGLSLVESWIVEDEVHDKSRKYGMDVPIGTWMGTVKVSNDDVWEKYVKTGKVKGFSIEGYFADKMQSPKDHIGMSKEEKKAYSIIKKIKSLFKEELESYADYPQSATNNAKKALEWAKKNGWGSCGTAVGKQRANQLAKREPLTRDTIARMASFKRHQQNKDVPYSEGCGGLMWDAWGGTSGVEWAINKLKKLDMYVGSQIIDENTAIIDDRLAYATKEQAIEAAKDLGCEKYHEHEYEGKIWYMPCEQHNLEKDKDDPCWDGYEMIGYKKKGKKMVPNCVPID